MSLAPSMPIYSTKFKIIKIALFEQDFLFAAYLQHENDSRPIETCLLLETSHMIEMALFQHDLLFAAYFKHEKRF